MWHTTAQPNGLLHATTVFNFYLAGSNQEGSCANRLYELLSKGCHSGSRNAPANLARVLVSLVTASLFQKSQSQFSLQCAGDIPAIILAVSSTYCPSTGLYNPLTMVATTCSPATVRACLGVNVGYGDCHRSPSRGGLSQSLFKAMLHDLQLSQKRTGLHII